MATQQPRNPEAHKRRYEAFVAADRSRGAKLRADVAMLVETGRMDPIPPEQEGGYFDNLGHSWEAGHAVHEQAKAAQREDRYHFPPLSSRIGLHPDVAAKEREGGYDYRLRNQIPAGPKEKRRQPDDSDQYQSRAEWRERPLH